MPEPRLAGTRWHKFVKTQAATFSFGCFLGREIFVGSNLIGQLMLLDRPGIACDLGRAGSVCPNRVLQFV